VQAILPKYGMSNWKRQNKQFAVDLKVAENSVADSEKLLMNQTFDIKVFEDKKILLKSVN
jgi:exonuclease SbcC